MELEVKLYGPLRVSAGTESITLVLDSNKLSSAVSQLCRYSQLKKALLKPDGDYCQSVIYLIGDEQVSIEDNPAFKKGDILTLLSPISGG